MKRLSAEVKSNYSAFTSGWKKQLSQVTKSLESQDAKYLANYSRLVSLQAWRSELLEGLASPGSLEFFVEAQNDAVLASVLSSLGTWRASLQCLRSCAENVLHCLYYMDHPVELRLWEAGAHRLPFSALEKYFREHPDLRDIACTRTILDELSNEYSTLSRAVHASAKGFRMSIPESGVQLWNDDVASLGKFSSRLNYLIIVLNQLLLVLFRSHMTGTSRVALRKAISLAIPPAKHAAIKTETGVVLFSP